jgi:hypothetical protein
MSNDNSRVLTRKGARQLTQTEMEQITGGKLTFASVLLTLPVSNPDETLDT